MCDHFRINPGPEAIKSLQEAPLKSSEGRSMDLIWDTGLDYTPSACWQSIDCGLPYDCQDIIVYEPGLPGSYKSRFYNRKHPYWITEPCYIDKEGGIVRLSEGKISHFMSWPSPPTLKAPKEQDGKV